MDIDNISKGKKCGHGTNDKLITSASKRLCLVNSSGTSTTITPISLLSAISLSISAKVEVAAQEMLKFLLDVEPILNDNRPPTLLSKHISKASDSYSPFREQATSRKFAKQEVSSDVDYIRTREGIFSATVFRGITFGAKFLNSSEYSGQRRYKFSNLQEFDTLTEIVPSKDLVNKTVYGTATGRDPSFAPVYWEFSEYWNTWLKQNDGDISFITLYSFFSKNNVLLLDKNKKVSFNYPEFGKLNATMIAIDLHYAGLYECPSIETFASHIVSLDLGALKALNHLHITPNQLKKSHANSLSVIDLIVTLYSRVGELLGSKKERLMPDPFHFEHTLCKMTKASNAKIKVISFHLDLLLSCTYTLYLLIDSFVPCLFVVRALYWNHLLGIFFLVSQ